MCTVTFIPGRNNILLTSNRDEKHWRSKAKGPEAFQFKTGKLIFPKDQDAGGTWFALHENGNAVVFLNGAFIGHNPQPPYKKSRGLILLDILDSESPAATFDQVDLGGIEQFTAVIWDSGRLFEARWDGVQKHLKELPGDIPHIWSSVTLYDPSVVRKREQWFLEWVAKHPHPSQTDILHFHLFSGDGDAHNDIRMNRGKVFTVSVTSALINSGSALVRYLDVQHDEETQDEFSLTHASSKA